jgi:chromosome segregation ATPase
MKLVRRLLAAAGLATAVQAGPVIADAPLDCMALRKANGWSRAEFRECKIAEMKKNIARLDADFEASRLWLQARGLDLNDAGHIIDAKGRTLATIEAQNAQLEQSNANLEQSNAALRATLTQLKTDNAQLDEEYAAILNDFKSFLNDNAN